MKEMDDDYFCWKSSYDSRDIVAFCIAKGDRPIVHIEYNGAYLRYYNRINGSRDGGMRFPKNYFDEHLHLLTYEEKVSLIKCINDIDFTKWKTFDVIKENYLIASEGFCASHIFRCVFRDGKEFMYIDGDAKEFNQLFLLLCDICQIKIIEEDSYVKTENKLKKMNICPACGMIIEKGTKFCAYCGEELEKYSKIAECEAEYDFEQTMMACLKCKTFNFMTNKFCTECGEKIR